MVEDARKYEANGAFTEAGTALRHAVGLWYGNAFEDVVSDALRGRATWLEELRTQSMLRYAELEISAGNPAQAIADLRTWTEAHPYHEGLSAQLIRALHGCGRTVEALEVYQRIRSRLKDELGLDPGGQLRALEQDVLSSGRPCAPVKGGRERSPEHIMRLLRDGTSMLAEAVQLLRTMVGPERT
jgi:DNA-binding SARP family transcriptional activator